MLRWLWRLGFIGVLVIAALWVWSKLNEDLEEEEFDEEIPIEFDVPVEDSAGGASLSVVDDLPAESSASVEAPAAADEAPAAEAAADEAPADEAPADAEEAPAASDANDERKTDLEDIVGIGPVFAGRLHDAGILSIAQLAEADAEKVREIGFTEAQAEEWIRQAQGMTEAAKGTK